MSQPVEFRLYKDDIQRKMFGYTRPQNCHSKLGLTLDICQNLDGGYVTSKTVFMVTKPESQTREMRKEWKQH